MQNKYIIKHYISVLPSALIYNSYRFVCVGATVSCTSISHFNASHSFGRIHLEADHCRDGEDDAASIGK